MDFAQYGPLVALLGMFLLLGNIMVRREARRRRDASRLRLWRLQQWGSLVAYAIIFLGLTLILRRP